MWLLRRRTVTERILPKHSSICSFLNHNRVKSEACLELSLWIIIFTYYFQGQTDIAILDNLSWKGLLKGRPSTKMPNMRRMGNGTWQSSDSRWLLGSFKIRVLTAPLVLPGWSIPESFRCAVSGRVCNWSLMIGPQTTQESKALVGLRTNRNRHWVLLLWALYNKKRCLSIR